MNLSPRNSGLICILLSGLCLGAGFGASGQWVGLALEALKYVNLIVANALGRKLEREYYVFQHSVTIVLWSFVATLVVLAGAHWTARHGSADPLL